MSKSIKILLGFILITGIVTQKQICEHLGFGQARHHLSSVKQDTLQDTHPEQDDIENYLVSDDLYEWNDELTDWVMIDDKQQPTPVFTSSLTIDYDNAEPIEINWKLLMNIKYELKYFKEIETEMYAPVFTDGLKAINGKEVIIEGYIMPIDVETDLKALSANPYSSCFFCGKASPASVMSLYLKKDKKYKMDAYKKFKGTLHLNYDDPNEFYYILKDAVVVK